MALGLLASLLPLADCGATLISLQNDVRESDRAVLEATPRIARLAEPFRDFADTAAVVAQLTATLRSAGKPVLLYCRSGNRAVRTYALVLASDPGGPQLAEILALARGTGHGVEDLRGALEQRIAARPAATGAVP